MVTCQKITGKTNLGNPVCLRTYFELTGKVSSPLLIGSGEDDETDMDVLLDAFGDPFLPGTSLAGALRHNMESFFDQDQTEALFGKQQQSSDRSGRQSRVFVYDAKLHDAQLNLRDGVRLDECKTAVDQAKYEMQIVEPGAKFSVFIELAQRENDQERTCDLKNLQRLLQYVQDSDWIVGAKGNRGFGRLKVENMKQKTFSMQDAKDRQEWLDWHYRDEHAFDHAETLTLLESEKLRPQKYCLTVPLKVTHTLLIRQYANTLSAASDYHQLTSGTTTVIPGSSWMGAIRARIASIMHQMYPKKSFEECQQALYIFFGTWAGNQPEILHASKLQVEESTVCQTHTLPITRNAIDRFTGGTVSGALYTAEVAVHGDTELKLHWPRTMKDADPDALCGLLLWAIQDLQNGLLAVGGETAVGRGIFAGSQVLLDEQAMTKDEETKYVRAAARWCGEEAWKNEGKA